MKILLSPPIAILIYGLLGWGIYRLGEYLAGPESSNPMKSSNYSSGELAPTSSAAPGYQPFFLIAFFFAILHMGTLVLGTGELSLTSGVYLLGLALAMIALILG